MGSTVLLIALVGCTGGRPPPQVGETIGSIPDMMGRTVMVLPVQVVDGVPGPIDPELEFALNEHGEGIEWIFPAQLQRQVDRTPALDMRLGDLPVGTFFRAEMERIGDPLFGHIRRLAGLTGAEMAIIPLRVRYRGPIEPGPEMEPEDPEIEPQGPAIEIMATVLDAVSGRVFWTGVVEGDEGQADHPATLASAADSFAGRMAWSAPVSDR